MLDRSSTGPENVRDPSAVAKEADLCYVSDDQPGFYRKRRGRGFTYLDAQGLLVRDAKLRASFEALAIPPAWTDVWICAHPQGHIQATGRDEKGRKQYIYHPSWNEIRSQNKFDRLMAFGNALPRVRERVDEGLRLRSLTREKVLAVIVHLLDETLIRVGNSEYARSNHSYGLTTLLDDHIDVTPTRISIQFMGKSGKQVAVGLRSRRLARLVRSLQDLPGQQLFQYVDENGECCQSIQSGDVNQFLRETTGDNFTAKEFRTWGGTVLAAGELYDTGPASGEKEAQKNIVQAVKKVASALSNTPAVCRQYYIHPEIFQAYLDGSLFGFMQNALEEHKGLEAGLWPDEWGVMDLLKQRLNTEL